MVYRCEVGSSPLPPVSPFHRARLKGVVLAINRAWQRIQPGSHGTIEASFCDSVVIQWLVGGFNMF